MTIEPLTVADLEFAAQFGTDFYRETGMPGTFSPAHFVALWTVLVTNGSGVILGWRHKNTLAGALAAMVAPDIYDGRPIAHEFLWYVRPEFRGQSAPVRLIRAYMEWAMRKGVAKRDIRISCMEGARPDDLEALYARMGFVPLERHYQYGGT